MLRKTHGVARRLIVRSTALLALCAVLVPAATHASAVCGPNQFRTEITGHVDFAGELTTGQGAKGATIFFTRYFAYGGQILDIRELTATAGDFGRYSISWCNNREMPGQPRVSIFVRGWAAYFGRDGVWRTSGWWLNPGWPTRGHSEDTVYNVDFDVAID
mgnify:CR=1 FL=1